MKYTIRSFCTGAVLRTISNGTPNGADNIAGRMARALVNAPANERLILAGADGAWIRLYAPDGSSERPNLYAHHGHHAHPTDASSVLGAPRFSQSTVSELTRPQWAHSVNSSALLLASRMATPPQTFTAYVAQCRAAYGDLRGVRFLSPLLGS